MTGVAIAGVVADLGLVAAVLLALVVVPIVRDGQAVEQRVARDGRPAVAVPVEHHGWDEDMAGLTQLAAEVRADRGRDFPARPADSADSTAADDAIAVGGQTALEDVTEPAAVAAAPEPRSVVAPTGGAAQAEASSQLERVVAMAQVTRPGRHHEDTVAVVPPTYLLPDGWVTWGGCGVSGSAAAVAGHPQRGWFG